MEIDTQESLPAKGIRSRFIEISLECTRILEIDEENL